MLLELNRESGTCFNFIREANYKWTDSASHKKIQGNWRDEGDHDEQNFRPDGQTFFNSIEV